MEIVDSTESLRDKAGEDGMAQAVHRLNLQLPYKNLLPTENKRLVGDIMQTLTSFDVERDDTTQVIRACSGLARIRDLKYNINDDARLVIVQTLFNLAFPTSGRSLPWRSGNKAVSSLTLLIGNKAGQLGLVGRLVLPWHPILDALKEATLRGFPLGSNSNEKSRLLTLLPLIGVAKRYWAPGADREIWDEVKGDINELKSQDAYKALFVLSHFLPSRSNLYDKMLPEWFRLWGQLDHCPAWDGAWLTIICRARKHVSPSFDWTPYMADIYSHARASVHTPLLLGDAGSVPLPGTRPIAYQYQAFAPSATRSLSAKAAKLGKLLVFLLGKGGPARLVQVRDVAIVPLAGDGVGDGEHQMGSVGQGNGDKQRTVSPAALNLVSLFRSLRTYFHPSNGGRWSMQMAMLTACVCRALVDRVGVETALREAGLSPTNGELTRDDGALVIDAILPLVLEMMYSKISSVGSTANICLSCMATLSPKTVVPAIAELTLRALDPIASINHIHQAPAAIRALAAVFRPLMYPRPYLAPYLPALLELSLPGLDPNDVFKTTITLQFYHLILCWIPVQGNPVTYDSGALDGWMPPPPTWLDAHASDEEGFTDDVEELYSACEGLGSVMMEWSVALLDRLFEVLRHKDKSSKTKTGGLVSDTMNVTSAMAGMSGGNAGGAISNLNILTSILGASGGNSALFNLIKLVTQQLFTMTDEPAGKMAAAKLVQFVTDSPLPNVEKDASAMVEMMAWARPERTMSTLFPALCEGLLVTATGSTALASLTPGLSPSLLRWRLRMLSGLARGAGAALASKSTTLRHLIAAGTKHSDKGVRKCARKLLRKALHGLCELWGADTRSLPPSRWANCNSVLEWRRLCKPIPVGEHEVVWIMPCVKGLTLAGEIIRDFLVRPMKDLSEVLANKICGVNGEAQGTLAASPTSIWREELKTMNYALRGSVCMLGDRGTPEEDEAGAADGLRDDVYIAVGNQSLSCLRTAAAGEEGPVLFELIAGLRAKLALFLQSALQACANGRGAADVKAAKLVVELSRRITCTRGAREHHARRQGMALLAFKAQQRDLLVTSVAKKQIQLGIEASARGDVGARVKARQLLATRGAGGGEAFPRVLVIGRVLLLHMRRLNVAPKVMAYATKDAARSGTETQTRLCWPDVVPWPAASAVLDRYRGLFSALVELSSAEYAMVRAAAQICINRLGVIYPWFVRELVPDLIDQLSLKGQDDGSPNAGDEDEVRNDIAHRKVTGACYLLHQMRTMRHVACKWPLLRKLLLALCDSQPVLARLPRDNQEKAAARVTILFTTYISAWRANTVADDKDLAEYEILRDGLLERLAVLSSTVSSAGGGWRYQLMASWCLLHLIRSGGPSTRSGLSVDASRLGPPSMEVWQWFADCLCKGDGQPLQRLALGAFGRLLSTVGVDGDGNREEVTALLLSRKFLRSLIRALARNHKKQATEAGAPGAEQWSLGVKEILIDAGRGDTRELFPRLRFAQRSRMLWVRNARIVSAIISAVGANHQEECIRSTLEEVVAAKAEAAHEDKRLVDCATAEISAGILAVLARQEDQDGAGRRLLCDLVVPFVEAELERVSLEGRLDWTDAIRFALDGSTLAGSEPLVSRVVERTMALLQEGGKGRDEYLVLVKWLGFSGAVLIELSAGEPFTTRAEDIARKLYPLLIEGLDHPIKACREEIARNLLLVTNIAGPQWGVSVAERIRDSVLAEAAEVEEEAVRSSTAERDVANRIASLSMTDDNDDSGIISALLARAMVVSDGASSEEQEASKTRAVKRLSLRRETVLQWMHQMIFTGDCAKYLPILVPLLPVALQSVRNSSIDVATIARAVCLAGAAAINIRGSWSLATDIPGDNTQEYGSLSSAANGVVNSVMAAALSRASWRVRRNAAAVACVFQTRLHFSFTLVQHSVIDNALLSLLGDARAEVHATARLAMSTRVAHLPPAHVRTLCARFVTEADDAAATRKKRRRIAKQQAAMANAVVAGRGEVAAIVEKGGNGAKPPVNGSRDAAGDAEALRVQQTGILGLSAVVLAARCDVPSWVPGALESLARHANDESPGRLPVRQAVTHTFKEFRQTHQDKWQESHKASFTRDQLDTFDDVLGGAHSYFV